MYGHDLFTSCRARLRRGGYLVAHIDSPFGRPDYLRRHHDALRSVFPNVRVQLVNVPLYGELAMAVCSTDADVLDVAAHEIDQRLDNRQLSGLRCYDGDNHHARFVLPPWVRRLLHEPASV
jgi:spermidine synthase